MANRLKNFFAISLAIVFLQCIAADSANAQKADVLTDKAILRTLEKLRGGDWYRDEICLKRLNEPAKIVIVGVRNEKLVCHLDGVFVDSDYFVQGRLEWSKNALRALGWEKANRQQREKLTKLLIETVLFAFSAKSNQTFRAVSSGDDETKVFVSLKFPPGVTSRHAPKIFVFDKDGNMSPAGDY